MTLHGVFWTSIEHSGADTTYDEGSSLWSYGLHERMFAGPCPMSTDERLNINASCPIQVLSLFSAIHADRLAARILAASERSKDLTNNSDSLHHEQSGM